MFYMFRPRLQGGERVRSEGEQAGSVLFPDQMLERSPEGVSAESEEGRRSPGSDPDPRLSLGHQQVTGGALTICLLHSKKVEIVFRALFSLFGLKRPTFKLNFSD